MSDEDRFQLVGFNAHMGFSVVEWREGHCVMELDLEPWQLNRGGVAHGGVLATLIDSVSSYAGNYAPSRAERSRSVTVALTIQYHGQARPGRLRAVGKRTGGGRRIFFARTEVFAEGGELLAAGDMTGRVFS